MGELVAKIKAKLACYNRIHGHLKKRWKTFSAPNASYSKKYLSQSKLKELYKRFFNEEGGAVSLG